MKEFSTHPQLKTSYIKNKKQIFEFIPPVTLENKKDFGKIPELGAHTKKIREEFK